MSGLFITFEGTEGGGKTTQIALLADRLRSLGCGVRVLREPGGTPIGEEIRHTLKHSEANRAMTAEAELLLMNASRAQLVREVIRPALAAGEVVLCDRFYDSTTAYQGYGRGLDLKQLAGLIDFAVGSTRPTLTLLLAVPLAVSEARRLERTAALRLAPSGVSRNPAPVSPAAGGGGRDRFEEESRSFFERVEQGYQAIATAEPGRVRVVDATASVSAVSGEIWRWVEPLLAR
jgi:dTMP kinase